MNKILRSNSLPTSNVRWMVALFLPLWLLSAPSVVHAQELSVATYRGVYGNSFASVFFSPFEKHSGASIHINQVGAMLPTLRAQIESGATSYDVVTLSANEATRACDEGLLTSVDTNAWLPPTDFPDNALLPCAVPVSSYAMPYVFNSATFSMHNPETIADFFDVSNFPGKRGLLRSSVLNLKWALLADGVPPGEVYAALQTEDGIARAFRKLDVIKDYVVWWDSNQPASQLLRTGKVAMSSIWSTQIPGLASQIADLGQVWDGHIAGFDYFGIPSGTPRASLSMELLKYAIDTKTQVTLGLQSSLGPVRYSSIDELGQRFQCASGTCPCKGSNTCSKSCCKSKLILDPTFMLSKGIDLRKKFIEWAAN